MNKTWRRRLTVLAIVSVCICVAALLARHFGASYARREIESQLRQFSTGRVEVGRVTIGWKQVVVGNVRLFDQAGDEPWLRTEQLIAKVNLWDAIFGNTQPHQVVIDHGTLTLRFDADGNLQTQLPELSPGGPLPCDSIILRDASLELERAGSPPLLATEIDGQLKAASAGIEASATVGDALGSRWQLKMNRDTLTRVTLSTSGMNLTGDELSRLPGLPDAIANIQRLSGAVTIGLQMTPSSEGAEDLRADVTLASLQAVTRASDWQLENGTVKFVVQNGLLQLTTFTGKIAGGDARLTGVFNLLEKSGDLNGTFDSVALTDLPAVWGIPPRLTGLLSADTSLHCELVESHLFLAGTAHGTINNTQVAGLPIEPVEIEMKVLRHQLNETLSGVVTVGLGVRELDVHEFLTRLDAKATRLADAPRGKLTGALQLTAPLQALRDPQQYRGTGSLSAQQITIGEWTAHDLRAKLRIEQGQASLEQVRCGIAGGTAQGRIVAEIDNGALAAELTLHALSLGELAKLTPTSSDEIKGAVNGTVALGGSARALATLDGWTANGRFNSDQIEFGGDVVQETTASFQLERGVLHFDNLHATRKGSRFSGDASLNLHLPHQFEATLTASELDLAQVVQEFPEASDLASLQGAATVEANLSGTLKPWKWQADGAAEFGALMLDPWVVERGDLRWRLDAESLQVTKLDANAYGGSFAATASIPFGDGLIEAAGTFAEMTSESLLRLPDSRVTLSGPVAGSFSVTVPNKETEKLAARVEFNGPQLSAYSVQLSKLTGMATYDAGDVQLKMSGLALDGNLSIGGSGRWEAGCANAQFEGTIHAEGIALSALAAVTQNRQLPPLQGRVDADVAFAISGPDWEPSGGGTVSAEQLRWNRVDLARTAKAKITFSKKDALVVENISARLPEGTARGEISVPLKATQGATFRLVLERVRARRLLVVWPELAELADGDLDLHLEGRMGQKWYGSARLQMARGELGRIPMQRLRAPFNWTFAPDSNRFQVYAHDATVHVGGGRITADLELTLRRGLTIKCDGRIQRVDLRTLLKNAPGARPTIDGDVTADFDFAGRDVRSPNDLTGSYQAKLIQSRSLMLPVLQDLSSALGMGTLTGRFDTTQSRGRLRKGGVIHVDEMFLANSDVQMEIAGRVWLGGRVNLDVTAHTGEFEATTLLGQLIRSPLRFIQPVGIGLLIRANDFFERRLLFFNIGGTFRNPVVRPRANEFLRQEVLLFFLDEAAAQLLR